MTPAHARHTENMLPLWGSSRTLGWGAMEAFGRPAHLCLRAVRLSDGDPLGLCVLSYGHLL